MLKDHDLKVKIEYLNDNKDVTVKITFTDIDGCYCDSVWTWLSGYNGKVHVHWGLPGNNSVENAELYSEAISLAIEAARIIREGNRIEDVWQRAAFPIITPHRLTPNPH